MRLTIAVDLPPAVHQSGPGGGNTITINIFDHGNRKPISTKDNSGAALVTRGRRKAATGSDPGTGHAGKGQWRIVGAGDNEEALSVRLMAYANQTKP